MAINEEHGYGQPDSAETDEFTYGDSARERGRVALAAAGEVRPGVVAVEPQHDRGAGTVEEYPSTEPGVTAVDAGGWSGPGERTYHQESHDYDEGSSPVHHRRRSLFE